MHTLDEVRVTLAAWQAAGQTSSRREVAFMSDVVARGRPLSLGQERWYATIAAASPPSREDELRLAAALEEAAIKLKDRSPSTAQHASQVAADLRSGTGVPQRVEKEARRLAEAVAADWSPEGQTLEELDAAIAIGTARAAFWWQHRPGQWRAFDRVRSARKTGSVISETDVDYILKIFAAPLAELKSPKFQEGTMVWAAVGSPRKMGLVVGCPEVEGGQVVYPVLISELDGGVRKLTASDLRKRPPS